MSPQLTMKHTFALTHTTQAVCFCMLTVVLHDVRWKPSMLNTFFFFFFILQVKAVSKSPGGGLLLRLINGGGSGDGLGVRNGAVETKAWRGEWLLGRRKSQQRSSWSLKAAKIKLVVPLLLSLFYFFFLTLGGRRPPSPRLLRNAITSWLSVISGQNQLVSPCRRQFE